MTDNKNNVEKDPLLLDHDYDGIQELDNPLPFWWLVTFYGAIIFSFFYWIHYHAGGNGPSSDQALQQELAAISAQQEKVEATKPKPAEIDYAAIVADLEAVKAGKVEYDAKCAACHGLAGQGGIGPNLTDNHWIHGPTGQDMAKTIFEGIGDKGMPPWKNVIPDTLVHNVIGYIMTLKGTNPAGAKAPEGTEYNGG